MKLYKLCPCYTEYVIVINTVTLVRNEFRPFVACAYTIERAHACTCICMRTRMHLDQREFACIRTHKCKHNFLRAFAYVHLRACSCTGLIKTQNVLARKKIRKTQTHFWFRNFQNVLYMNIHRTRTKYLKESRGLPGPQPTHIGEEADSVQVLQTEIDVHTGIIHY